MPAVALSAEDVMNGFVPVPSEIRTTTRRKSLPARKVLAQRSAALKSKPRAKQVQTKKENLSPLRTSTILRNILENNPGKSLTVRKVVEGLGSTSFGTSLMVFSLPEVLPIPIPGISAIVVIPTGIISLQMIRGKQQIDLPDYLLNRSIPRKGFAAAVHAILPILEKAEKTVKPRGNWVDRKLTKRFLGLFILLLAGIIALPIPGTNMPAAIAIFIISLGMVGKDGLLITLGILLGIASVALIGGILFGLLSLLGL